jgi:DNA-binding transcriptional MerR regulator
MSSAAFAYPQKSAEAFRTISEVSQELDVPQHVLRFWESRFTQVKPVKRAGGRRYYRPDDVDLLKGIRALLYTDGLTIKGVQKVLKERGLRHVAELGRGNTPPPQTMIIERPVVVEKIVYVEKPVAAAPAPKKAKATHLRAVPDAMSLPFFDMPEVAPAPKPAPVGPVIQAVEMPQPEAPAQDVPQPEAAEPETGLLAEERDRLDALLDDLLGLKARLQAARERMD